MGIDKLNKAANAAGFAMANSEDLLLPNPVAKRAEPQAWRPAETPKSMIEKPSFATAAATTFRDLWFTVSGKATA